MKRLVFILALVAAAPTAALADFADGLAAYDGGDYATALSEWQVLADAGDARAQAALAGLYRYGQGVRADPVEAARWYRLAAEQGEAMAQLNLGEMYDLGLGVGRDPVEAYRWLSLAAAQGRRWAKRRRDAITEDMSPADLAAARALLRAHGQTEK
jgi:TPR repeat protein